MRKVYGPCHMSRPRARVLLTPASTLAVAGTTFVVGAPLLLGLVARAPSRLQRAEALALEAGTTASVLVLATLILSWLGLALWGPLQRAALATSVFALAVVALVAASGAAAWQALDGQPELARASPTAATWAAVVLLLALLMAASRDAPRPHANLLLRLSGVLFALAVLMKTGALDALSVVREASARQDELAQAATAHLSLASASLLLALGVSVALVMAGHHRPRLGQWTDAAVTAVQVVPSIALFGMLMAPLSMLATAWPALRSVGIGGVGAAPAILGIAAYLLLPLVSGFKAALMAAEPAVIEAARAQGMTRRQILRDIQLPLGAPLAMAALRVALVQAIGLATLAALVGAGGLGRFIFDGIGQFAADLIILGTVSIAMLALLTDGVLAAAEDALKGPVR